MVVPRPSDRQDPPCLRLLQRRSVHRQAAGSRPRGSAAAADEAAGGGQGGRIFRDHGARAAAAAGDAPGALDSWRAVAVELGGYGREGGRGEGRRGKGRR